MIETINDFKFIITEIKNDIKNTKFRILENENSELINLYFRIGKIIDEYSKKLIIEVGKKYNKSTLFRMKKFYNVFKDVKVAPLVPQLTWSHCITLLPIKDIDKINYYIKQITNNNLTKRQLQEKIKNKEYERLDEITKQKLIDNNEHEIQDYIKHPIIIKNTNYEEITEKVLEQLILDDMDNFLKELGEGFTYVGHQYKIKVDNTFNYIDILLFNIKYNCYTVVELKTTKLKKEHIGQIQTYMNYIDSEIKSIYHNPTIGIIICKENNEYVIKYCSNPNIHQTTYLTINEEKIEYI